VVAWFDFHGDEPPPDFDPHPRFKFHFARRKKSSVGKMSVTNALHGLIYAVEWGVIVR
jgi:hypothetical protein